MEKHFEISCKAMRYRLGVVASFKISSKLCQYIEISRCGDRPAAREIKLISMFAAIFGYSICVQCFFGICLTGFDDICLDDRVTLTKCSIYRNVLLVCSTRYDLETGRHYVFGWRSWREGPQKLVDTCAEYQV